MKRGKFQFSTTTNSTILDSSPERYNQKRKIDKDIQIKTKKSKNSTFSNSTKVPTNRERKQIFKHVAANLLNLSNQRCKRGIDQHSRTVFSKYNNGVTPGLRDAFAKNGTLYLIFLVRDWRNKREFTMRNEGWQCHFHACGELVNGTFYVDKPGGVASSEVVMCVIPASCESQWSEQDSEHR